MTMNRRTLFTAALATAATSALPAEAKPTHWVRGPSGGPYSYTIYRIAGPVQKFSELALARVRRHGDRSVWVEGEPGEFDWAVRGGLATPLMVVETPQGERTVGYLLTDLGLRKARLWAEPLLIISNNTA